MMWQGGCDPYEVNLTYRERVRVKETVGRRERGWEIEVIVCRNIGCKHYM